MQVVTGVSGSGLAMLPNFVVTAIAAHFV